MKNRIIAERYASALLSVSKKKGEMERVFDDMAFLKKVLIENPSLKRFLESPHITQEAKIAFIERIFSGVIGRTSMTFLLILIKKVRIGFLSEITEEYQRLFDIEKAVQRTDVITAFPIDDTTIEKLHSTIEQSMKKAVKLCLYVDPQIIGGVIIKTPTLIIDGSIRRKLRDISYAISTLKV